MKGQQVFNLAVSLKPAMCNDILINVVHILACNEYSGNLESNRAEFHPKAQLPFRGKFCSSPVSSALRAHSLMCATSERPSCSPCSPCIPFFVPRF